MIRRLTFCALLAVAFALPTQPARAWGDEGHEIIATIAASLLRPAVRSRIDALLATDEDPLTDHDIAAEATWADHLRDANPEGARIRTRQWHFVDIERRDPSLDRACFGHPPLPPERPASLGPARACLVDRIDQFASELASRATTQDERLLALKFLLHLVGDLHQPLHAADDDDRGGNAKRVTAPGFRAGTLHHYWDTEFVLALSPAPEATIADLKRHITPADIARFSRGTPEDWARDTYAIAIRDAYGHLPPATPTGTYRLDDAYIDMALRDVRLQLIKAAIRLAALLNRVA